MQKNYFIYTCGAAIVVLLVAGIVIIKPFDNKVKGTIKDVENKINKIGVDYYTKFYYPALGNPESLSAFSESGLAINLKNLNVTNKFDEDLVKLLEKFNCSYTDSKVYITPRAPFGVKDYSIEVSLSCN